MSMTVGWSASFIANWVRSLAWTLAPMACVEPKLLTRNSHKAPSVSVVVREWPEVDYRVNGVNDAIPFVPVARGHPGVLSHMWVRHRLPTWEQATFGHPQGDGGPVDLTLAGPRETLLSIEDNRAVVSLDLPLTAGPLANE